MICFFRTPIQYPFSFLLAHIFSLWLASEMSLFLSFTPQKYCGASFCSLYLNRIIINFPTPDQRYFKKIKQIPPDRQTIPALLQIFQKEWAVYSFSNSLRIFLISSNRRMTFNGLQAKISWRVDDPVPIAIVRTLAR